MTALQACKGSAFSVSSICFRFGPPPRVWGKPGRRGEYVRDVPSTSTGVGKPVARASALAYEHFTECKLPRSGPSGPEPVIATQVGDLFHRGARE